MHMTKVKYLKQIIILLKKYDIKLIKIKTKKLNILVKNNENNENNITIKNNISKKIQPEEKITIITSPIVGTFYSSPSPNDNPFVNKGDFINPGDTICIIEAMKTLNEIKSEYKGIIEEIFIKNETVVEYNQKLFKIKHV